MIQSDGGVMGSKATALGSYWMYSDQFDGRYLPAFVIQVRTRLSSRFRATVIIVLLIATVVAYYILLIPAVAGDGTTPIFVTCNKGLSASRLDRAG